MNSRDVKKVLKKRYTQPEWSIFFEVSNGTGGNCSRYADAIAFNMFPSKGLEIVGFEIKVSRGDLLSELKNPEKADEIGKYCDTWYLVTPKGLINPTDDIPSYWGIIEVNDDLSTRIKKRATKKEAVPITKSFMMAAIRRASEFEGSYINEMVNNEAKEKIVSLEKSIDERVNRATRDNDFENRKLKEFAIKFKDKTGVDISSYSFRDESVIECFKFAQKYGLFGYDGIMNKFNELKNALNKIDSF